MLMPTESDHLHSFSAGLRRCCAQGGTRVMGVVAGGFLPAELRGTKNFATIHVADWCECSNGLPHHLSRHAVV